MAGQQAAIYENYLKGFADVVNPTVYGYGKKPKNLAGETWTKTERTRKWGESYSTQVWISNLGRVIEKEQILYSNGNIVYAVFENETDWNNYRKPMGMYHYLYG